jgi:rRNA maturation endonuclease Nob1
MSKCKKCKLNISGDCMLTIGVCVFCYYGINSWDSNGQLVTKKEAILWECPNCHKLFSGLKKNKCRFCGRKLRLVK